MSSAVYTPHPEDALAGEAATHRLVPTARWTADSLDGIMRDSCQMARELVERLVPNSLWALFLQVVPAPPIRPQGGGSRRRHGDREVLAVIVFAATSGCSWNQLPSALGPSGVTAFRRFTEWSEARVWTKLHRLVHDELGRDDELNWSRYVTDSCRLRANHDSAEESSPTLTR